MNKQKTVAEWTALCADAERNCAKAGNHEQGERWAAMLGRIERVHLPSGAGIDSGCTIERRRTGACTIVIAFGYHHMDEDGFYTEWTHHRATIRATFGGIDVTVSGQDRNEVKEYLADTFREYLTRTIARSDFDSGEDHDTIALMLDDGTIVDRFEVPQ